MQTWQKSRNRGTALLACISLEDIQFMPTRWVLPLFWGFLNFRSDAKFRSIGAGGGKCILFENCEKRPFHRTQRGGSRPCCFQLGHGLHNYAQYFKVVQKLRFADLSARPTILYKISCLVPPLSSVLVPLCMLDVLLQINVNACGQKLVL